MMKATCLLLCFAAQLTAQVWTRLPDFPGTKRDDGAGAVVNNLAFFGTGLQEGWSSTIDWYTLDLTTFQWQKISDMAHGAERQYACAFAGPNRLYVFGGDGPNGARNDLYCYDLLNKTWSQKTSRPGKGVIGAACLPMGGTAFIVGGKVHHDSIPGAEVWAYDITNDSWQRKADLPYGGRWRSGGATLGALGYLAAGIGKAGKVYSDFLSYEPGTDSWNFIGQLPVTHLTYLTLQPHSNKLVLFGGQDSATSGMYLGSWYYRIAQGDWQPGPFLPSFGRKGGMAVGWNEKLVYTCGMGPGDARLNETWMLDLPLGLDEAPDLSFSVFPNPFEEGFYLDAGSKGLVSFVLSNMAGIEVLSGKAESGRRFITTQELEPGLYLLKLADGKGNTALRKLIRY